MFEKNWTEIPGVLLRKYPAFVLSARVTSLAKIPVFVFHDVTIDSFEPILRFLSDNRYATLTADEYTERQVRGERGQEREVLLTFDDGLKSLYTVAYPALKRFDLKAVAYIVSGITPQDDGSCDPEAGERALCSWRDIREMHDSGVLDIQSHSMYHHSIPTSSCVIDFARTNLHVPLLESYQALPYAEGRDKQSYEFTCGTPIYRGSPRFRNARAYLESPSVSLACIEYVDLHGGPKCFQTPHWRRRLNAVIAEARRRDPEAGFETETERRKAILKDFVDSKHEIEQRLPGKIVRHFCYPWFLGSALATELSAEAGYISNAWGSLLPNFLQEDALPIPVARLSPSYLWRLPGKGRKPLREVLQERFSQLCRKRSLYG
jgi:hypothetical protein